MNLTYFLCGHLLSITDDNRFIREWAEYYIRILGVSTIYLYDDGSSVPLNETVLDWIHRGSIVYHWVQPEFRPTQRHAFHHCFENYARRHRWLVIFDTDEYLYLRDMHREDPYPLATYLDQYRTVGSVTFPWIMVGHDDHEQRPDVITPMAYFSCGLNNRNIIKSACNTKYAIRSGIWNGSSYGVATNIHSCFVPRDEHNARNGMTRQFNDHLRFHVSNWRRPQPHELEASLKKDAYLFHYILKSQEDYDLKQSRGGGSGKLFWRSSRYRKEVTNLIKRQGNVRCYQIADTIEELGFAPSSPGSKPDCLIGRHPVSYGNDSCVKINLEEQRRKSSRRHDTSVSSHDHHMHFASDSATATARYGGTNKTRELSANSTSETLAIKLPATEATPKGRRHSRSRVVASGSGRRR